MHKIALHYALTPPVAGASPLIRNPLLDMLHAVQEQGSISAAAREMGLSYRHVWGELRRWEQELGGELLVWEKGQSARLSPFGDKLLWAERQAQARLAPQIEALRADLERAFAVAFDPGAHVVTLYASHDDALTALREHATRAAQLHLDVRFTGSVDAISALNEGRCTMAGFHTLVQPARDSLAARTYRPLLKPGLHKVIGFARRDQGLIVARGNPLGLHALADLCRPDVRFVNRTLGTGTRLVLDELLQRDGLAPEQIRGYHGHAEPSHAAVAQSVAAGSADAGLGIASAAQAKGLDFVPLVQERYHLVCLKAALAQPAIQSLLQVLQQPAWHHQLGTIAGYVPDQCGSVLPLSRELPWWHFQRAGRAVATAA
ncbi:MAG TPA: substrate-binding domain-containing protein [Burkholderiaceae bacterium]